MGICCCKPCYFQPKKNKKIVLLLVGLDNAGKTTAARGLAGDIVDYTIPTVGFTAIKPKTKGYDVTIYDLGGGVQIRDIWKLYFHYVHGVIYVVDASDLSRIEESKTILENLLRDEKLAGKPVLVLANKQDQPNALDEIDVVESLQLEPLVNEQKCHTLVKVCSAIPLTPTKKKRIDKRLLAGYRWLLRQIVKEYDVLNERVETDSKVEADKIEAERARQRKRYDELEKKNQSNGLETNGLPPVESSTKEKSATKPLTLNVRDQLEDKNERQRFSVLRGRKYNKVHPESVDNLMELKRLRSSLYSPRSIAETSMTVRAITSPLHANLPQHTCNARPLTSRSLGHEGVWGLDREMDIIYPAHGDGAQDEVIIEYLKKD
ncbi:hypothetical protein O3M35_007405 [Rhynocoris fuscipes]|uniref:ADP-ribosylation factor-like protein 13B n=1 Tax=Rhynocoris fuscipes TaxID=488301 RepID=A0AAW1DGG8_9HEMI